MAGCINGIDSIEVKAPNGESSTLFPKLSSKMSTDDAYKAYLLSETPQVRSQHGLTLDKNGEVVFEELMSIIGNLEVTYNFKSGVNPNGPTPQTTTSIGAQLVEESKLIGLPEEDAEGNQASTYYLLDSVGNVIREVGRVSSFISNFIYGRGTQVKGEDVSLIDYLVDNKVSRDFKGIPAGGTFHFRGKDYTREEYEETIRNSYKQGIIKGNIIHSLLELQLGKFVQGSPEFNKVIDKIKKYKQLSMRPDNEYDWVLERDVFGAIVDNLGFQISTVKNKLPAESEDKIYTEVALHSDILDVGGQIDILKESQSGHLQVTDTKTGNNFDRSSLGSRLMKYGNQNGLIYDDSKGRAKLQTMLYSIMIKLNHPEAKLLPPQILHLPSQFVAKNPNSVHQVDVVDYLTLIENYMKAEQPDTYKQMIARSPDVFNPMSYGATSDQKVTELFVKAEDPSKLLLDKELELQRLQNTVNLRISEEGSVRGDWTTEEKIKRDELMRLVVQARTMGIKLPNTLRAEDDIRKFTKWVGTINDTHNPFIQAYAQIVEQSRSKIREEYHEVEEKYNSLLTKVMQEQNMDPTTKKSKNLRLVDSEKFFSKYIINRISKDDEGNDIIDKGVITKKDAEWKNLTSAEQEWLSYMQDTMKNTFNEVMVSGPEARIASKNGKPMTKLDIYNLEKNFQWSDDFIPRVSVTKSEVRYRTLKNFNLNAVKDYVNDWAARAFSMYYEEHVDGYYDKTQYGIPVRFLGSGRYQHNPDIHSSNLEHTFKSFMQHYINKKHYDSTYAIGDSVKQYLALQDGSGNKILQNSSEFIEYHMSRNLQGRLRENDTDYLRKGLNVGNRSGIPINFSLLKFGKSIGGLAAAAGIWLKPVAAAKNAVQALWAVSKHGWTNAIAHEIWTGLKVNNKDTGANMAKISRLWADMQKDFMLGKGEAHPIKVMMDTFELYPDVTEVGGKQSNYLTAIGKVLNTKTLSFLHSYPEDWSTSALAVNTLMSMKIEEGKYKGQSMWDIYSNSVVVDPVTSQGKFVLPEDFTRGKVIDGSGQLRDWKGLEPVEIQKIKKIIQSVKGGYRMDERTMLESTALGEMAMIFKRWLPASIINAFQGKRQDTSLGYFEQVPGEDYYAWRSRIVEGRFRTIGGVIAQAVGLSKDRGYKIDQLSDLQKKNLVDAGITLAAMMVALAVYSTMMDREDKDSIRVFTWDTSMRLLEQWNVFEMVNTATSQPMVVKTSIEFMQGILETSLALGNMSVNGDEEDIYTRRGDLKGMNKIIKNNPVTAWYYNGEKFIDGISD